MASTEETEWYSKVIDKDGEDIDIGALAEPGTFTFPHPPSPRVFICHTGRDGDDAHLFSVKEYFARPTKWFLEHVIGGGVSAFFDDGDGCLRKGRLVPDELTHEAYKCTHALVLISPVFRTRKYCVKELNTFMQRWKHGNGIKAVIPILWKVENVEGFHEKVNQFIRITPGDIDDVVTFLTMVLWPELCREFNVELKQSRMKHYVYRYVQWLRNETPRVPVPAIFDRFEKDYASSHATILDGGIGIPSNGLVAIVDAALDWNVRRVSLKGAPENICGDLEFKRTFKAGHEVERSDTGPATLMVGQTPVNVNLTVIKLPTGNACVIKDRLVEPRLQANVPKVPSTVLLVGLGNYDMRFVSSFRDEYDIILGYDGMKVFQPSIGDARCTALNKSITLRTWCALALNVHGYCISHIPNASAPWGLISLITSICLACPFPLAVGAGRTTICSNKKIDPWQVVGADRHLWSDVCFMVPFVARGVYVAIGKKCPSTLLEGFSRFGHHIFLEMIYKFWWVLNVPPEKAKNLLATFVTGNVLAGTIPTFLMAPGLLPHLAMGVVGARVMAQCFVSFLDAPPRKLWLQSVPLFGVPWLVMHSALLYVDDRYAKMLRDNTVEDDLELFPNRYGLAAILMVPAPLFLMHVLREVSAEPDVLRRDHDWGAFRHRPAPSRLSLVTDNGPLQLAWEHTVVGAAVERCHENATNLPEGIYR